MNWQNNIIDMIGTVIVLFILFGGPIIVLGKAIDKS